MPSKTPAQIAEFKRKRAAMKLRQKERATAEEAAANARMYGKAAASPKTKPKPTATQVHSKKAEAHRKKYTPSGMQSLVDAMADRKK